MYLVYSSVDSYNVSMTEIIYIILEKKENKIQLEIVEIINSLDFET